MQHAFEIVHLLTDSNPIQVLVDAIINRHALSPVAGAWIALTFDSLGLARLAAITWGFIGWPRTAVPRDKGSP